MFILHFLALMVPIALFVPRQFLTRFTWCYTFIVALILFMIISDRVASQGLEGDGGLSAPLILLGGLIALTYFVIAVRYRWVKRA